MSSALAPGVYVSTEEAAHELYSIVPEPTVVHLAFTLLAVFILFFGMFSALIKERIYIGEAIVATAFGVAFGPYGAGLFNPRSWGDPSFDAITLEFTRVVLALSVFAVGVELPRAYVKRHWRSLAMVIGPLMVVGWLVTGAFIYALIPGLSFLGSLTIAACATPTDPILAASVVGKGKFAQKHVPSHIRHLLQCESGCNDGAAFPFLYLALFLNFREGHSVGEAIGWWILLVILYQIILGIVIGTAVGICARKILKFSKRRSLIDRESMVAMYVSLAIFTTAVTTLAGSDDLLAAFACGAAFAWDDWFSESIEDSNFSNIIDLLVNCATFIYIGATIPFSAFNDADLTISPWRLVVIALAVLLLRRLPAMLLLYKWIPDIKTFREAVFAGHFGPMGVGAIFIATLALTKMPTPNVPPQGPDDFLALNIQPIIYFIVLCSVIVHGSSIPFFNLGKRVHSISRTWTNRSDSEPSWLSRVKQVGDGTGITVNRDDDDSNDNENNNEKKGEKRQRRDVDLEAGESVMDDAGMDVGDMTSHDYADNEKRGRDPEKRVSPTNSEDTINGSGSDKGKGRESSPDNEDVDEDGNDHKAERHDSSLDEEQVWQEGTDTVIDRDDGETTEVIHEDGSKTVKRYGEEDEHHPNEHGHHNGSGSRERNTSNGSGGDKVGGASGSGSGSESRSGDGPGFPGFSRMQEIAAMIQRGHDMSHESHDRTHVEHVAAKAEGKRARSDEKPAKRLLENATERVVKEEGQSQDRSRARSPSATGKREQQNVLAEPEGYDWDASEDRDEVGPMAGESSPARKETGTGRSPAKTATPGAAAAGAGASAPPSRPTRMSTASFLHRPKAATRKPTLSAEEKYARDAWCRKERRDVDDDEVRAWVSGKHLVIERNNGEDVEVVDANPSQDARELARKNPDLKLREVDMAKVNRAKGEILNEQEENGENEQEQGKGRSGGEQAHHHGKRFDLKAIRNNASFRKIFGESHHNEGEASGSSGETDSSAPKNIRFASGTGDRPRREGDSSTSASSSSRNGASSSGTNRNQAGDTPNYLSTRGNISTGVPLERSETTESQVRFAKLPVAKRK